MRGFLFQFAVRTGLEPATPGVTGRYSNQTELPHRCFQSRCKNISFFLLSNGLTVFFLSLTCYFVLGESEKGEVDIPIPSSIDNIIR